MKTSVCLAYFVNDCRSNTTSGCDLKNQTRIEDSQKQPPEVFYIKKVYLKIWQYSQENTSTFNKAFRPETLSKRDSNTDVFL